MEPEVNINNATDVCLNPNLQPDESGSKSAVKTVRLTELSHGGGCGCKIDPASLHEILAKVPKTHSTPDLLVGIEHSDDAAVFRISDDTALVFTNDFFTATVDDPYTYGRIAAANALSDIYAMGGSPIMANAIVGFPVNTLDMECMQEIMHGGVDVCRDASIPLAGGHSIDNPQPIFGLAAVGKVHPANIKTNSGARVGDVLLLTKPLGIGVMASAFKLNLISPEGYKEFVNTITMLNKPGAWLGEQEGVHAMTDITGFGLAGHLLEMAKGAQVSMELDLNSIPVIEEAWTHVVEGIVPGGAYRNMHSYGEELLFEDEDLDRQLIYSDPQTNGGLLVSVHPDMAEEYRQCLEDMGYEHVAIVGEVKNLTADKPHVIFKK
jgi:selenide,water dikinase